MHEVHSRRSTSRRIPERLFIVVADISNKFRRHSILLHQTNLQMWNLCTFHIRAFMYTIIIIGFCTLFETVMLPADDKRLM